MSRDCRDEIYLGTVLLERNRWVDGERRPSLAVSDWTARIADAGFDGLELWENHAVLADQDERERLRESPVPVRLFNCYDRCGTETLGARRRAAELAAFFGAEGMKYNFGRDESRHGEYVENVKAWRAMLPAEFRFLCECHGGTTVQDPARAAETFARLGGRGYEVIIHGFGGDDAKVRDAFRMHGERITHVHANLSSEGPMPEGRVRSRVALLREAGFRGSFTIEFTEGVGAEDENPEDLFASAARDAQLLGRCLAEG